MTQAGGIGRRGFLAGSAAVAAPAILSRGAFAQTQAKEIPFAVVTPLSGPIAYSGIPARNGAELAADVINAAGGIKALGGAKLKMMVYDTESKADVAKLRSERAIQDGACTIIGSPQSAVARVITQVADQAKVPNIVDLGSGDFLTESGSRYVFRVMPSNTQQTLSDLKFVQTIGDLAKGKPVKRIAMLYEDSAAGQEYTGAVKKAIGQYGLELIEEVGYPSQSADLTGFITRLKRAAPDFVMSYSFEADSILILRTMLEQNYTPPGLIGKSFSEKVIAETGALSEAMASTAFYSYHVDPPGAPKGTSQKFRTDYVARFKTDFSPLAALSYTAVIVMANAMERAKSADRDAIRDALATTDLTGKDGILQIVERIKFDEKGSSIYAATLVDQIQKKDHMVVFPANVAEVAPIYPMPSFRSRG